MLKSKKTVKLMSLILLFCLFSSFSADKMDNINNSDILELNESFDEGFQNAKNINNEFPKSSYDEKIVGYYNNNTNVNDIAIYEHFAYTVGENITILDISDLTNPIEVGVYDLPNGGLDQIIIHDDFMYTFDSSGDIYILNLSIPEIPDLISSYSTGSGISDMSLKDNILYYSNYSQLISLNVSDPQNFQLLGVSDVYMDVRGICIDSNYAYITENTGYSLYTINISDPYTFTTEHIITDLPYSALYNKFVFDQMLYITDEQGFTVVNISDPLSPSFFCYVSVGGMGYDIYVENERIYVATLNNGLKIFDKSNIYNIIQLNEFPTSGTTWRLQKEKNYLYTCEMEGGFRIFQLSQYEWYEPILINGNAELDAFPNKVGDGTPNSPYIIQNLHIFAGGIGSPIRIENTDKTLIIDNCVVNGSNSNEFNAGIYLFKCANITIQNCRAYSNFDGIFVEDGENCSLINNIGYSNCNSGIQISNSVNQTVVGNDLFDNDFFGLKLNFSSQIDINNNYIDNNGYYGVLLQYSSDNSISHNLITRNGHYGIIMRQSISNYLFKNRIIITQEIFAVFLYDYSDQNLFLHNSFIRENTSVPFVNIDSTCSLNFLGNETHGNFWSDYEEIHPTASNNRIVWNNAYDCGNLIYDYYPLVIDPTRTESEIIEDVLCYWDGNQNGNDSINDIQGYLVGDCSYSDGLYQEGFQFNGNGFVNIPHEDRLNFGSNDFAIDLWVNFDYTEAEMVIAEKYIEGNSIQGWSLTKINSNWIRVQLPNNALDVQVDIIPQTWNHIIFARVNNEISITWNEEVAGSMLDDTNLDCTSSLKLGHRGNPEDTPGSLTSAGYYLYGKIDEVQISTHSPDISDTLQWDDPLEIGHYQQDQGYAQGVFVEGNYAYVVYEQNGLDILDISDPANPILCSNYYSGGGNSFDIEVHNGIAYIADGELGTLVLNVNNVYSPHYIAYLNDGNGYTRGIAYHDEILYVADGLGGIDTYNVSDPYNIYECDKYDPYDHAEAWDIVIEDNYAYVAWGFEGLHKLDVSDPYNIYEIGYLGIYGDCRDLKVSEGIAYLAYGVCLKIVDVSEMGMGSGANEFSTYYTGYDVVTIEQVGNIVMIGGKYDDFAILDVSDLENPMKIFEMEKNVVQICFSQNRIFLVCRGEGLFIFRSLESHEQINIGGNYAIDEFFSGSGRYGLSWADAYIFEYKYISTIEDTQAIMLSDSDRYIIIRYCIFDNPYEITDQRHGIETTGSSNVRIENCAFRNFYYGVVTRSPKTEINQNIFDNCRVGIEIRSGYEVFVTNNVIFSGENGITMSQNSQSDISGNIVSDFLYNGISISQTSYSNFNENTLQIGDLGMSFDDCSNNLVERNYITAIDRESLLLINSDSNTFDNNNFYMTSSDNVIFLENSGSNNFQNNLITVSGVYAGFYLVNSNGNTIEHNTIIGSQFGIDSPASSGNIIRYNIFDVLNECFLDQTNSNTFEFNDCTDGDTSGDETSGGNTSGSETSDGNTSGDDNPFSDFDLSNIPGFTFEGILTSLICSLMLLSILIRKKVHSFKQ